MKKELQAISVELCEIRNKAMESANKAQELLDEFDKGINTTEYNLGDIVMIGRMKLKVDAIEVTYRLDGSSELYGLINMLEDIPMIKVKGEAITARVNKYSIGQYVRFGGHTDKDQVLVCEVIDVFTRYGKIHYNMNVHGTKYCCIKEEWVEGLE